MPDASATPSHEPTEKELAELYDNPLERLQLLGGNDEAITAFLDELDVRDPREREMLRELTRTSPLAHPGFVLRGAALASRRIRLSVSPPLSALWRTVGSCGKPPQDPSRRFAVVAISLTLGVWIVLPLLVTLSLAT
jgi:hypothetical protein